MRVCRPAGAPILHIGHIDHTKMECQKLWSMDVRHVIGATGRLALGFQHACTYSGMGAVHGRPGCEFNGSAPVPELAVGAVPLSGGTSGQPSMCGAIALPSVSAVPWRPAVGRARSVGWRSADGAITTMAGGVEALRRVRLSDGVGERRPPGCQRIW
jgi:hypothetical protein